MLYLHLDMASYNYHIVLTCASNLAMSEFTHSPGFWVAIVCTKLLSSDRHIPYFHIFCACAVVREMPCNCNQSIWLCRSDCGVEKVYKVTSVYTVIKYFAFVCSYTLYIRLAKIILKYKLIIHGLGCVQTEIQNLYTKTNSLHFVMVHMLQTLKQ